MCDSRLIINMTREALCLEDAWHIKTHLWDLSTNLSKLNIVLNLKNNVLYES